MARPRTDPLVRFLSYVRPEGECLLWTGGTSKEGYGKFWCDGTTHQAHLWLWRRERGPVPEGMVLDHFKCDTPGCVRLDHLRPATNRENILRSNVGWAPTLLAKTHCPQDHAYDEANTYIDAKGDRACRRCRAAASLRYKRRVRAAARG